MKGKIKINGKIINCKPISFKGHAKGGRVNPKDLPPPNVNKPCMKCGKMLYDEKGFNKGELVICKGCYNKLKYEESFKIKD